VTEARILRAAPEKLAPAQGIPTPFFSVTRLGEDLGVPQIRAQGQFMEEAAGLEMAVRVPR